jgi:hypothetical protein
MSNYEVEEDWVTILIVFPTTKPSTYESYFTMK